MDHWPTAYAWGIVVWAVITWFGCKYYPEDAARWQDILLGGGIILITLAVPMIWLPSPKKSEKETKKES